MSSREPGPSIALTDLTATNGAAETSIGDLVREATVHVSTLVRAELALAKSELVRDGKKVAVSSAFVIIALVVLLYSSFFFFFFLGFVLEALGLPLWAAFGIVFLIMVGFAVAVAVIGYRVVRKVGLPKKTIQSVKDLQTLIPQRPHEAASETGTAGAV